jgi:hypothetical protein
MVNNMVGLFWQRAFRDCPLTLYCRVGVTLENYVHHFQVLQRDKSLKNMQLPFVYIYIFFFFFFAENGK